MAPGALQHAQGLELFNDGYEAGFRREIGMICTILTYINVLTVILFYRASCTLSAGAEEWLPLHIQGNHIPQKGQDPKNS